MSAFAAEPSIPFSIVVASWSGRDALVRCLDSLVRDPSRNALESEIVVAYRGLSDLAAELTPLYPGIRFIRGPRDASVFVLRTLGVISARGGVVALLEDHSMVEPGWAGAFQAARAEGHGIVGGAIDNDEPATPYDWALYLVEYGIYMPPMQGGPTAILSGVNMAYDRALLVRTRDIWAQEFYETDVSGLLLREGEKLHLVAEAPVRSRLRMGFAEAMNHLFTGGIHFGQFRQSTSPKWKRILWAAAAPAVSVVLLLRILRLTLSRRPDRAAKLIAALPSLLLLLGAWSWGEAVGYFRRLPTRVATPAEARG